MGHSIVIPDDLNNELTTVAKLEEIPKSKLIREAIKNYLRELKEDREDAEIALARSNNKNDKLLTSEEAEEFLRKRYGL
ncbi:MAG: ribbon-helix-helix domain-containing protein [Rickettsia endosymbiont of Glossina mortisans submortisans]|nr:ribbon-helix-helix domain-containing protein [Rickettsia endosymbiont of Glossina mortisans submortisans]HJD58490.1 ribbon-helix-helix domain-containing protein [Rickettsia endosymbiont of Ceroptres masudai]